MVKQELYIDGQLVDLGANFKAIPITFAMNEIGNTLQFQGNGSRSLTLPFTTNNNKIFGNANIVQSITNSWSIIHNCTYLENGLPIIENGNCTLETASSGYEIIISDGITNLADALDGLSIRSLNYDDLEYFWNFQNVKTRANNSTGVVCGQAYIWSQNVVSPTIVYDTERQLPAVYLHTIIERIFSESGYHIEGDILTNPHYLSMAIPLIDLQLDDTGRKLNGAKFDNGSLSTMSNNSSTSIPSEKQVHFTKMNYVSGHADTTDTSVQSILVTNSYLGAVQTATFIGELSTFTVPYSGEFDIEVKVDYTARDLKIWICKEGGQGLIMIDETIISHASSTQALKAIYHTNTFSKNDRIFVVIVDKLTTDSINDVYLKIEPKNIEQTQNTTYGQLLRLGVNLPDIKQFELLKFLVSFFALTPRYDKARKTLELLSFNAIHENIPNARDWSNKLDASRGIQTVSRLGNFAQINKMVWKNEDGIPSFYGDSEFTIDNKTLPKEQDVFKAPFSPCLSKKMKYENTAVLPYWKENPTFDDDGLSSVTNEFSSISPRIILTDTIDTINYQGSDGNEDINQVKRFYFLHPHKAFDMNWNHSKVNYYPKLIEMLQDLRVVTARFNLTSADVSNFDHYVPVYIDHFGAYFYVNQIRDYIQGIPTTVELIRL